MTYKEIIKIIKNISLALPDVESFYTGDVYEINKDQSVKYGSVVLTNQEHSFDNINDQFNYNFVLFYIDRLTDDENNRIDVQTAGINALTTIVKTIEDYGCIIDNVRYNVFKERFNDWCSGVYGTFSIQVDDNDCVEEFEIITPEKLKAITINSNGTYKGLFNEVNVQVPTPKFKLVDGNKFGYSTIVDASLYDTSQVTDFGYMFNFCENLSTLDLNGWDTSSVTTMNHMFYRCRALTSLDLSHFDTSNVTDISWMFCECVSLTSLDISNFNTENVIDMSYLFRQCPLTSLNLSHFNTAKVTNMHDIFYHCRNLISLDLSGWNMSNVSTGNYLFRECTSLANLNMTNAILPRRNLTDWNLDDCTSLTVESLVSVLNALPQLDEGQSLPCSIGATNIAKLSDTEKAIATNKNWRLV